MKIRQARKICLRGWWGGKADDYFNRIKQTTYNKALRCRVALVTNIKRKRRKEAGE